MTNEQLTEQIMKINGEIAELRASGKSAHKRLDENDRVIEGIYKLATNVESLAIQVKLLTERVDKSIERIEARLEQANAKHDERLKEQGKRIGALESEPAHKWKDTVKQVIALVVAAVVGAITGKFTN